MRGVLEELLKQNNLDEERLMNLFFYKLLGFQNDKEIRLLTIDHNNYGDVNNISIDAFSIIKDIMFDPRMPKSLCECYKC